MIDEHPRIIALTYASALLASLAGILCAAGADYAAALGWGAVMAAWVRLFLASVTVDPPFMSLDSDEGRVALNARAAPGDQVERHHDDGND